MAHIANKIDAKDKKLAEVLNSQRYKIDVFQREYRWQRTQIEALISDLTSSFMKSYRDGDTIDNYNSYDCYYMGPIVLCEDDKGDLSIIDGQQRLTSLTLLLIYLSHQQKQLNLAEEITKDITPYLIVKKGGKKTLVINVDARNDIMNKLIIGDETFIDSTDIQSESIHNIIDRYEDIITLFPAELNDVCKLPLFIEWLLEKVVLVEVRAYSMENAYSIFETMNDRGLSLNPTEILKGYMLSKIVESTPDNEIKAEEANNFWTERIHKLKSITSSDSVDMDFFRAWLRAKYADTQRSRKSGSENEDFELIGTQFHSWVKNNTFRLQLKKNDDYYFFIKSDFDFYSSLYIKIYESRNAVNTLFPELYLNNIYSIADSLAFPLYLSPITKMDDDDVINVKISLIARFIDRYANIRTLQNRSITQSSIRIAIYEIVKQIRNLDSRSLRKTLDEEIEKLLSTNNGVYQPLQTMNNNGYFHYLFARLKYYLDGQDDVSSFKNLLRTRKHNSYILCPIFSIEDTNNIDKQMVSSYINSAANYCLVRRDQFEDYKAILLLPEKIDFLKTNGGFPELPNNVAFTNVIEFINMRDSYIAQTVNQIWG